MNFVVNKNIFVVWYIKSLLDKVGVNVYYIFCINILILLLKFLR